MSEITREQVVDYLSNLPVIQIAELVKALEEKWGVSAAPVAVAGPAGPAAEAAPQPPAAEKPAKVDPKKMSTADILAAARGKKSPAAEAAPQPPAAEKPAKADPTKMSTADILAAARGKKSDVAEQPADESVAEQQNAPGGSLPKETADIISHCRQRDGK